MNQVGLFNDMTNEDYHKAPGLSFSALKAFSATPAHYQAYLRKERTETASQRLGTLVHMRTLEPDQYATKVAIVDGNRNSNAVKAQIEEAQAKGLYVCKTDEHDLACRMSDAVIASTIVFPNGDRIRVGELLAHPDGVMESSIFWMETVEVQGSPDEEPQEIPLLMKCRPDFMLPKQGLILDLKTFSDLSDRAIEKQVHNMKYHWQAQHYLRGLSSHFERPANLCVHSFATDEDPFLARSVFLDPASLEKAEYEMRPLIERFAVCQSKDEWPGYSEELSMIALPSYAW